MLGLQPPRDQSVLDEAFDVFEELVKRQLQEIRKQAIQLFPGLQSLKGKDARDTFRSAAKQRFSELSFELRNPVLSTLQILSDQVLALDSKPKDPPQVFYQKREGGECPKINNQDRKIDKQKEVLVARNDVFIDKPEFLQFDRYQEFITYKGKTLKTQGVTVNIQNQGIYDTGMEHFTRQLNSFSGVEQLYLNLSNNNLTQVGAQGLADALFHMKSLRSLTLNLYNNKIKVKGVQAILQSISVLPSLIELSLDFSCNAIGNGGAAEIGNKIADMRSLNKLWLSVYDNQIYEEGMNQFLNAFQRWPVFKTLTIDFRTNPASKANIQSLKTYIKHKKLVNYELTF